MYTIVMDAGVVIRNDDGKQVAPCQDAGDPDFLAYLAWVNDGNAPRATYLSDSAAAPVEHRIITKLAYMNRFQDAELAGLYTAAKTVIQVEVWLEKFKMSENIDLDDPRTVGGVQALEAAGLLGPGRAAEILA